MVIIKKYNINLTDSLVILLALFMPLFPKALPILIILLFLSLFINYKNLRFHREFKTTTWLFALTYLFYVFGLLSSEHIRDGLFVLEVKLSFLLLPIFFLFHGPFHILTLRRIFFAFVAGCFINTFFGFYKGYNCYLEHHWWECYFTTFVSYNFHTTYLAIYFCFSLLILIYFIINYFSRLKLWQIAGIVLLMIYLSAFVVMLSSKGGLIALAMILLVSAFYFFYKSGNFKNIVIGTVGLAVLLIVVFFSSEYARIRINEAFKDYQMSKSELFEKYRESTESTAVRLMIWHVSDEVISRQPFGVGTGDSKYVLLEKYKENGMTGAYDLQLNCHNQYYETTLAIGIHGLVVLCIFLFYLLITAIRKRNFLLLWVVAIVMVNLFFESMFETQAGVIFFVFFSLVLLTSVPEIIPLPEDEKQ